MLKMVCMIIKLWNHKKNSDPSQELNPEAHGLELGMLITRPVNFCKKKIIIFTKTRHIDPFKFLFR